MTRTVRPGPISAAATREEQKETAILNPTTQQMLPPPTIPTVATASGHNDRVLLCPRGRGDGETVTAAALSRRTVAPSDDPPRARPPFPSPMP
eukprot:766567-Hanusia_phi.AAC.1